MVRVADIKIGKGKPLVLIAGPCVIESAASALFHAGAIAKIARRLDIPFIFKSSYDKANRSSVDSFRGPGLAEGLSILKKVKEEVGIPVLSDVHCCRDVEAAAKVLDVIQIPALLCRQTDLLQAAAKTGKPVNLKKGQFLAPWDMKQVIEKIKRTGNQKILLTERGTCFGYNNLVSDMRALPILAKLGCPVIYDATHSAQREFVLGLSCAAVAMGIDGLFLEVHKDPKNALCDGPNMINLKELENLLARVKAIRRAIDGNNPALTLVNSKRRSNFSRPSPGGRGNG